MKHSQANSINLILLIGVFLVLVLGCSKDDDINPDNIFTDPRDGKVYQTVKIGNQVWMAENLAYAPNSGIYLPYGNNQDNVEIYGYLYDWETACKVCPPGWHLPSDDEWAEFIEFLGGLKYAGGKLKATGTIEAGTGLWYEPNTGATNESGFSATPSGGLFDGNFEGIGSNGYWWSATMWNYFSATAKSNSLRRRDSAYKNEIEELRANRCMKDR